MSKSVPSESAYSENVSLVLMTTEPGKEVVVPTPEDMPLYRIPWERITPPITTQLQELDVTFPLNYRQVHLHVLQGVNPDLKVNVIRFSGYIEAPAHLTRFSKPLATSMSCGDGKSNLFLLERKNLKAGELQNTRLILPKNILSMAPHRFAVEYELEDGQCFSRTLCPISSVDLPINHEVLAIRVEGMPPVKQECILDIFGKEHPVTVDFRGVDKPVWVIRFQDTSGETQSGTSFLKEGFNFSRILSPRIIFDPTYAAKNYAIKITALSLNQFVELGPFDFRTNFRYTL